MQMSSIDVSTVGLPSQKKPKARSKTASTSQEIKPKRPYGKPVENQGLECHSRLAELMTQKGIGIDIQRLQRETGVTVHVLMHLYHSRPFPQPIVRLDLRVLKALSDYFGCNMDDLFEWLPSEHNKTN